MILTLKDGRLAKFSGRPVYRRRAKGEMNATEAAYSDYLDLLLKCGKISSRTEFEPVTLKTGKRKYKPDFRVTMNDGTVRLYDVKGCKLTKVKRIPRPWVEPQDRLRIEMFARAFPQYRFVLTFQHAGCWFEQEIVP